MVIRSAKELEVYRKAYELAMLIFEVSKYISSNEHENLSSRCAEVGRMLGAMIQYPKPFLIQPRASDR